ncbi:hypothetical protein FQN51_001452 [Onygenales sp. PD_10]|nr:hypothetical protein FQN51_001452 [Onygenales sp. PD_10]
MLLLSVPETWQAAVPRLVAASVVSFLLAWLVHLVRPAFSSGVLPRYGGHSWPKGKRGLWQYYSLAYECVSRPDKVFKPAYAKDTAWKQLCSAANQMVLMPLPHSPQGFLFLLPVELLDEFARQPDKVVSLHAYTREVMHPKYTTFGENFVDNSIHYPVVYRELGQKLASQTHKINDETVFAVKDILTSQLDKNGELSINMWETSLKLLTQVSNRAVIGLPLCRNQEFLDANRVYSDNMFSVGLIIRLIPSFLRPLLAPIAQRPLLRAREIVANHALPVIKERMRILDEAENSGKTPNLPSDLLTATMKIARNHTDAHLEYTPLNLVHRVMGYNFLQTWTQALTLTNAIFDLISLPQGLFEETVADIRAEITAGLEKSSGSWTHELLETLEVTDAFLRESMRWNPIGEVGIERTITSKYGFTFSNGLHAPRGATLAAPNRSIQRDRRHYPGGFNPKRALHDPTRPRATTVSREFLNFGLGRPACPGRWFAVDVMKLVIGHLLMEYDFERVDERPQNVRKLTIYEPSTRVNIVLRKRVEGLL